jgi:hypothetical protein
MLEINKIYQIQGNLGFAIDPQIRILAINNGLVSYEIVGTDPQAQLYSPSHCDERWLIKKIYENE